MSEDHLTDLPYVVLTIRNTLFAFSSHFVKSIIALPKVVHVPRMPEYFRGVINLRGQVIPLLDLRLRFGYESLRDEGKQLCESLMQRRQDHLNWIAELKKSVEERRPFTLATDHHKCAFGRWFDTYKTNNIDLTNILNRFDRPHRAIHAIAIEVKKMEDDGDYDKCFKIIEKTENRELSQMIKLFDLTCRYLTSELREIVVVLERRDGSSYAAAIDQVTSVEHLEEKSFEELSEMIYSGAEKEAAISAFCIQERSGQYVQVIDPDLLIDASAIRNTVAAADAKLHSLEAETVKV